MKKNKSPILLITVLPILLAIGAYMGVNAQKAKTGAMPHQEEQQPAESARETPSKEQVAKNVKDATNTPAGNQAAKPIAREGEDPIIVRNFGSKYKPKPSDSNIHGQWYSKEHTQNLKGN